MADRPTYSTAIAELRAGRRDRDEDMLQALVTAGALVALADGELAPVERGELLTFIDRQGFISDYFAAGRSRSLRQPRTTA